MPKKDVLFIIGDWNAKVGSQEILGVTGKFGLGLPNKAGQRLTPSSNNIREDSTYGHHQMVNTEIRLIIFFAAEDGEALYSQQKQYQELTVHQFMKSLLTYRLTWKKIGETARPFRYDLSQIPYDYIVEVTYIQEIRSDRQSA